MKINFLHQKILTSLYPISLLFFGYFLIKVLLGPDPTKCVQGDYFCLGTLFGAYASATIIGVLSLIILLQLAFLMMTVFKKEWLSEHISFKILSWSVLLVPIAIVIWMYSL